VKDWYYARGGQQNGPVTFQQLKDIARGGGLDPQSDLVWTSSMKDWSPAGSVEGLFPHSVTAAVETVTEPPATGAMPAAGPIGGEPFRAGECVRRAFGLVMKNFGVILLAGLASIGVSLLAGLVFGALDSALGWEMTQSENGTGRQGGPFGGILGQVVSVWLSLGWIRLGLNLVDGKEAKVGMLFGEGRKLLKALLGSILFGLMVVAGLLLLIVPGIYLALRYGQYLTAIVDRDLGVMEAFAYSSAITTNNRMNLFVLGVLSFFIILAGILALLVGLIVAYPVVWLGWLVAYRWLQAGHRAAVQAGSAVA
jgi:hypothetical protein